MSSHHLSHRCESDAWILDHPASLVGKIWRIMDNENTGCLWQLAAPVAADSRNTPAATGTIQLLDPNHATENPDRLAPGRCQLLYVLPTWHDISDAMAVEILQQGSSRFRPNRLERAKLSDSILRSSGLSQVGHNRCDVFISARRRKEKFPVVAMRAISCHS